MKFYKIIENFNYNKNYFLKKYFSEEIFIYLIRTCMKKPRGSSHRSICMGVGGSGGGARQRRRWMKGGGD